MIPQILLGMYISFPVFVNGEVQVGLLIYMYKFSLLISIHFLYYLLGEPNHEQFLVVISSKFNF